MHNYFFVFGIGGFVSKIDYDGVERMAGLDQHGYYRIF